MSLALVACAALCFSLVTGKAANREPCAETGACDDDVVSLLSIQQTHTARHSRASDKNPEAITCKEVAALPKLDCCADADECSPFTQMEEQMEVYSNWDWLSQGCKMKNPDVCTLWKGCVGGGDLKAGAKMYLDSLDRHGQMWSLVDKFQKWYCHKEHCNNTAFDLEATTTKDAEKYCDEKFGKEWRDVRAGPSGMGINHHPGSGIWECAHGNYHCDWAYCQIGFCDKALEDQAEGGSSKT